MILLKAILAAGCFWGVQAKFDDVKGVYSTRVGYIGGSIANPNYQMVSTGKTGYAEAIEITYNPKEVSYEQILDIFFKLHDPTTKNRQGPDIGTQYRSAIFYLDDEQKQIAVNKIDELNKEKIFSSKIVTEVVKAREFYPAEEYHQKYNVKNNLKSCVYSPEPAKVNPSENKNEDIWAKKLSPEKYRILREKGTEKPFSGALLNNKEDGTYVCGACGNPIFKSDSKYDSGSGWPSFDEAISGNVKLSEDKSHGMTRTEVSCAKCGSHLGHLFHDGPTKTHDRFCINSMSMDFNKK